MAASLAAGCPTPNNLFDIATNSGSYGELTGLLAGFAFTALVFVLESRREGRERSNRTGEAGTNSSASRQRGTGNSDQLALVLLAALVSLILATLAYAVLAGESDAKYRAASEELVDGLPFGLAVIMLFYGIAILARSAALDRWSLWVSRSVGAVVTPAMTLYYLTGGVSNTVDFRAKPPSCGPVFLVTLGTVLSGALALGLLIVLFVVRPFLMRRLARAPRARWLAGLERSAPITVLVASISAAVYAAHVANLRSTYLFPTTGVLVYIILAFILLLCIGTMLIFGYANQDVDRNDNLAGESQQPGPTQPPAPRSETAEMPT